MEAALNKPPLLTGQYAFFFDFDGTLAKLKPHPSQVSLPDNVQYHLRKLADLSHGALALISGRSINELDKFTQPERYPLAGVHGAERRDINGQQFTLSLPANQMNAIRQKLQAALGDIDGVQIEEKPMAFALHYRHAPGSEPLVHNCAQAITAQYADLTLQQGKCVVEIKPGRVNKGEAVHQFMAEPPFSGRIPVFLGDDLTDEAGFDAVNQYHGVSIKVGQEATCARWRLEDVPAVWSWLSGQVAYFEQQRAITSRRTDYESFGRSL
ncbi:trehalose phosphatase [Mangrovibacter sp. MFB070]|uniref:trehalose-phosphatase n=1 Tax=Mangrovibacter sp. MFB070 TaxID=1224318 RepID=UPI0004D6D638|nr:trehalose-phosphatase [Mangrovibacter sp. MFB070]KEA51509.1 trehalose phosphatase [Mangrovibacter sp. MFB070]